MNQYIGKSVSLSSFVPSQPLVQFLEKIVGKMHDVKACLKNAAAIGLAAGYSAIGLRGDSIDAASLYTMAASAAKLLLGLDDRMDSALQHATDPAIKV